MPLRHRRFICEISEADLEILIAFMEEESSNDQDYFVEHTAIDALEERGASEPFVARLRNLVGDTEGADSMWARS